MEIIDFFYFRYYNNSNIAEYMTHHLSRHAPDQNKSNLKFSFYQIFLVIGGGTMNWNNQVHVALDRITTGLETENLFHDSRHRQLFIEITNCYCDKDFFTPGMIKCMYMASWDDEHFSELLMMLMEMSLSQTIGLHDMSENGVLTAEELTMASNSTDATIYQMSCAFIQDEAFDTSHLPEDLNEHGKQVISYSSKASDLIDQIASAYAGN